MTSISSLKQVNTAKVYLKDQYVGNLLKIATDEYQFRYDSAYVNKEASVQISRSIPFHEDPPTYPHLPYFFDNLLMEGWSQKQAEKIFKLDGRSIVDRFALLVLLGRKLMGAVSIVGIDSDGKDIDTSKFFQQFTAESQHKSIVLENPYQNRCCICLKESKKGNHKSCNLRLWDMNRKIKIQVPSDFHADVFKNPMQGESISGAQRKGLFGLEGGVLKKSVDRPRFILKPEGDYPEFPANEHATMLAAHRCGFATPPVGLFEIENIGLVYVVKRFDFDSRYQQNLIAEDFAQICHHLAEDKFNGTLEQVAESIDRYCISPLIDKIQFLKRLLFCFLSGNGDMHLKNWSLLEIENEPNCFRFSPIYDFLNVRASYPSELVESALSLGGKRNEITGTDFKIFAQQILKLPSREMTKAFDQISAWRDTLLAVADISKMSPALKQRYQTIVEQRFRALNSWP